MEKNADVLPVYEKFEIQKNPNNTNLIEKKSYDSLKIYMEKLYAFNGSSTPKKSISTNATIPTKRILIQNGKILAGEVPSSPSKYSSSLAMTNSFLKYYYTVYVIVLKSLFLFKNRFLAISIS